MRSPIDLVLGVVLVAACSTDPAPAAAPPSSLVTASGDPRTQVTPPAVPGDVEALGLAARYGTAQDPNAAPCQRFLLHAARTRAELGAVQTSAPDAPKIIAVHLPKLASTFGRFDGLLLGELQHSLATYGVDGGLTEGELSLITLDLRAHLRAAGVPAPDLDALDDALDTLAPSSGPSTTPTSRAALGKLVVRIALLLSTLQSCAPHGT